MTGTSGSKPPDFLDALNEVPRWFWVLMAGVAAAAYLTLLNLDGRPGELRALAGVTVAFVVLLTLGLGPRSIRPWTLKFGGQIVIGVLVVYTSVAAAEGLHVGWAWPVTVWLDLFDDKTVLIDVLDAKRTEHHEHCGQYGCNPDDHYWIRVGGSEWPVTQSAYDVLREGEVVEVGYRPHSKFVEYVAYGPALATTRGAKQLRVAVTLDPSERKVFEDILLPEFKERTGYDVTFLQMEPDTLVDILSRGESSPFDLLAIDNNRIGELVALDAVQDLSSHRDVVPAEVLPSMRALAEIDGKTLFLPFRPNVMVTYFDRPEFGALGLEPPRTWAELLTASTALEEHGDGIVLQGASGPPAATQIVELLWQAGGDPLDLDSPESLRALEFLSQLAPHLDQRTNDSKFDTVNQYLADGDVVLAPNWTFGVSQVILAQHKDNLSIYPGWAGPGGEAHVLGGDVMAVPAGAPRQGPALKLAAYLMSRPAQATMADQLFWPAIRDDAYTDADPQLRPYWDAINDALAHASPRPRLACWSDVEDVLADVWHKIVVQGQDPTNLASRSAATIDQRCSSTAQRAPTTLLPTTTPTDSPGGLSDEEVERLVCRLISPQNPARPSWCDRSSPG